MPAPKDEKKKKEWKLKLSNFNKKNGIIPPSRKNIVTSNETKQKISLSLIKIGHKPPNIKGIKRSSSFIEKVTKNHSKYWKGKNGKNSANWRGGKTKINSLIRSSIDLKIWRESIFRRDNFTCQKCNISGGILNSHHILNFSQHEDLRFAIDNGITLCKKCHILFHKEFGRKNNTKEQLLEFLNTNYEKNKQ